MLTRPPREQSKARKRRQGQRKWHDEKNIPSLGCITCPEFRICGGLRVSRPLFWCLDYCCNNPKSCDVVCRNNPKFVGHIREIGGFGLEAVARAKPLATPSISETAPLLFHGNSRHTALQTSVVALPFSKMFDRRVGQLRFKNRADLCSAFKVDPTATIILSGTDKDSPIEKWWHFGREVRTTLLRGLAELGIRLATSPNYSLFVDQPRWDDLHSMKRIAIIHSEMLNEGIQAALHVNGRTETDFRRWTEFLQPRDEIGTLAYEFATGTGWAGRRETHVNWLRTLAHDVDRPLHLIIRGGIELIRDLELSFESVTVIDTAAFMRTMKRRRAIITEGGKLVWRAAPTPVGQPLDNLLSDNVATVTTWIHSKSLKAERERKTA